MTDPVADGIVASSGETDPRSRGSGLPGSADGRGPAAPTDPGWRASLSGGRGLAILLVLAFHVGLPIASGGLVGVTLFFVLSGYLITTLLLRESTASGTVDLRAFMVRRLRRLLPALACVVCAIVLLGFLSGNAANAPRDGLFTLLYAANWARAAGDPMGLLNHAWSLSIEGQFYLIWPIGFAILARRGASSSSWTLAALIALAVVVTVLRAVLIDAGASSGRIYFGTDVRADALLVGCALAVAVARWGLPRINRWFGSLAMVAITAASVLPTTQPLWPGSGYAFATIASLGVVVAALGDGQRGTGLGSAPLTWIGERSYSLYLVHVPILMLVGAAPGSIPPAVRVGIGVAVAMVVAIGLYTWVEQPFRKRTAMRIPSDVRIAPAWRRSVPRVRARLGSLRAFRTWA
jgi:peptidoglycan/LPS O-acetylase OafA/YrhL